MGDWDRPFQYGRQVDVHVGVLQEALDFKAAGLRDALRGEGAGLG